MNQAKYIKFSNSLNFNTIIAYHIRNNFMLTSTKATRKACMILDLHDMRIYNATNMEKNYY